MLPQADTMLLGTVSKQAQSCLAVSLNHACLQAPGKSPKPAVAPTQPASKQADPLPALRRRLEINTALCHVDPAEQQHRYLPPTTETAGREAYGPITPPPDLTQHRTAQAESSCSSDSLHHTHGSSRRFAMTATPAAEQLSETATVGNEDSFRNLSTSELDWLDIDGLDVPATRQQLHHHTSQTHSLPQTFVASTAVANVSHSVAAAQPDHEAGLNSPVRANRGSRSRHTPAACFGAQQHCPSDQHQAFDDLFDTRQSSLLNTQPAVSELSAKVAAGALQKTPSTGYHLTHCNTQSSLSSADNPADTPASSGRAAELLNDAARPANCVQLEGPVRSSFAHTSLTAWSDLPPQQQSGTTGLDQREPKHQAASQELAPGAWLVSTSHLEIMGWGLYADTLGTFQLLSDSASESTSRSLPEPSDFGPVTPAAGVTEVNCTPHRLTAVTPFANARHDVSLFGSQDLGAFDVPFMEDCLHSTDPPVYEVFDSDPDAQDDNGLYKHNRHAYMVLESPRITTELWVGSRDGTAPKQPHKKQRQYCGCYRLSRRRDDQQRPSVRGWWATFCAKRRARWYPAQDHID